MNKKLKISLWILSFLGVNGAVIPSLENNFKSVSSFGNLNWGGGTFLLE